MCLLLYVYLKEKIGENLNNIEYLFIDKNI